MKKIVAISKACFLLLFFLHFVQFFFFFFFFFVCTKDNKCSHWCIVAFSAITASRDTTRSCLNKDYVNLTSATGYTVRH